MAGLSSRVDVNTVLYNKTGKLYTSGNKNAACKYKLYENKPEEALVPFEIWKASVVPHPLLFYIVTLHIFLFIEFLHLLFNNKSDSDQCMCLSASATGTGTKDIPAGRYFLVSTFPLILLLWLLAL